MTPSTNSSITDRDIRQRSIVPPERLAACHALVIGVGAIGRQVALQLAALGMSKLTLFDDDDVGVENLAPQAIGRKISARQKFCRRWLSVAGSTPRTRLRRMPNGSSVPPLPSSRAEKD